MSNLSPEALKTLAPTTDAIVTKLPGILKTAFEQYSSDGRSTSTKIPVAPKNIVHHIRRGEIVVRPRISQLEESSTNVSTENARVPIDARSAINGYGDPNMSEKDVRNMHDVIGIAEADASLNDGEEFPIVSKGVMSVPTMSYEPIRAHSVVIGVVLTEEEVQRLINSDKVNDDIKKGKRVMFYRSIDRSQLMVSAKDLLTAFTQNQQNRSSLAVRVASLYQRAIAVQEPNEQAVAMVRLCRAIIAISKIEEAYVLGTALSSSEPGPYNSFDLKIAID
jgi:hypothetical protein